MAIELHHLNTHGMMEQAGNVLDGVVRLKARIAELEALNHDLEEERRWRKCSEELPEKDKYVLAFCPSFGSIEIARIINNEWRDFSWNFLEVTHWMPLPSAPKEEK